jgi:hypothetical protein
MTDMPLSILEYDEHGRIIITLHQVLDQVVDNAQQLADQANHNALLTEHPANLAHLKADALKFDHHVME